MSILPCQKIPLIAKSNNELYILDDKFKFLIKKENDEKNICIKMITYFQHMMII